MMSRQFKVIACLTLALAVVFYVFWQICKQQPDLANVATFTEDPYDAVGSFATQFALFTALLSIVRAFRPYSSKQMADGQQMLFARGAYLTCLSIAVTLGADVVAMLCFPAVWIGIPAGYALAALVGGMALLTTLVAWSIHSAARKSNRLPASATARGKWASAIVISLVGAIICAVYPQNWRQGFHLGGFGTAFVLITALIGMVIFFASTWAWGIAISPTLETPGEDFIDDLVALYGWFKARIGSLSVLLTPFEKLLGSSFLRPIVNVFNPRKNRWYGIALVGLCLGALLSLGEGRALARLELFASIECLGLLVGYAIFVKPLWLARSDSAVPSPMAPARGATTFRETP